MGCILGPGGVDSKQAKQLTMCTECDRLAFMLQRDGADGAVAFAQQVISQYRSAVLHSRKRGAAKPSHGSLPIYRPGFINSYVVAKRFIAFHTSRNTVP